MPGPAAGAASTRPSTRRGRAQPRRIAVIGGSLAGMFAAAATSGGDRSVTVLERDRLPDSPQPRPGVPQALQPHVLLYRGLLALEQLLPGLRADLLDAGAVPFDTGDVLWLGEHGWAPPGVGGFEVVSASRPLLEYVVRRRVSVLPGVEVRTGSRVRAVRRAEHVGGWRVEIADGSELEVDLVIDASGRGSRLPGWLREAGVPTAQTTEIDARVGYATRVYAAPPDRVGGAGIVVLQTPTTLRGGSALPVECGRWLVSAVGSGACRPPRDADAFEAFLADLRDPAIATLVRTAEPVGDVAVHRQTGNRRHHYERLTAWPAGLLVVGDALCTFNPVYGQGIAVAACEALLLRRALGAGLDTGSELRLLRQFSSVAALPWAIAAGEDLRYATSGGRQSRRQVMLGRWAHELGRLSTHGNRRAQETLSAVYHLMASPVRLIHPALLAAALRARIAGYGPAIPRPAVLDALDLPR